MIKFVRNAAVLSCSQRNNCDIWIWTCVL